MRANKMKLSPLPYIRNNKGRTSALIISITMFMVMMYMLDYIIGCMDEPFRQMWEEPFQHQRDISVGLGFTSEDFDSDEEFLDAAWNTMYEATGKIETIDGIKKALVYGYQYVTIHSLVGESSVSAYLFGKKEECEYYLEDLNAKLVSGRMPEEPGEIVVDEKVRANQPDDSALMKGMGAQYKIVGTVSSGSYPVFGIAYPGENNVCMLLLTTKDASYDFKPDIEKLGYECTYYYDLAKAEKNFVDSMGSMDTVRKLFVGVSGSLLLICVVVVMSIHIMDRHNEWCLEHSIGFGTGEIYIMALKELLISIGAAVLLGIVISWLGVFFMEKLVNNPIGISVHCWRPKAVPLILVVIGCLLAIIQIPLFHGMKKIQTIDAIE